MITKIELDKLVEKYETKKETNSFLDSIGIKDEEINGSNEE